MFSFQTPTDDLIRAFIGEQARLGFTYSAVGATASAAPSGYQFDHARFPLGDGEDVFKRAKTALQRWKHFDLGWAHAHPDDTPIEPNKTVAVVLHTFGVWSLCSAKIVYVVNEPDRFGFAYGTLPGHVESGEERFLVECDDNGTAWYDVLAFSRPRHFLTKIGSPLVRRLQKRFVRESAEAMRRAASQIN